MQLDYEFSGVPELPPRSTLYCLQPIGIGSPSVESLTSFILRLTREHRVSLSSLLEQTIAPLSGKPYIINGGARVLSGAFGGYFRAMNSTGETAAEWLSYLETLTLRNDLFSLTLRRWRFILSPRGLVRVHKVWCPECYADQLKTRRVLYEPLLWSVAVVTVCPTHRRPLLSKCPRCRQNLFHLSRRARPGHCYRCGRELSVRSPVLLAAKDWELWIAEAIADLIADGRPDAKSVPTTQIVAQTLNVIVENMFEGNVAKFARTIGKQKNSVWGWFNGNSKILLKDLVNLCYCLQITLRDFLSGSLSPEHLTVADFRPPLIQVERRQPSRQINRGLLEQNLLNILGHQPVPSMQKVARLLSVDKRLLYRHFSEICRAIADKRKQASTAGIVPAPNSLPR